MFELLETNGLKRYLASLLLTTAAVVQAVPGLEFLQVPLLQAAAILGGVGLVHASVGGGSFLDNKFATLASILAVLIELSKYVPALAPYAELLSVIGGLLGLTAVAAAKK